MALSERAARRIAHRIAYRFLQQALDVGGLEAELLGLSESDQQRIDEALDQITQRHFEWGHPEDKR